MKHSRGGRRKKIGGFGYLCSSPLPPPSRLLVEPSALLARGTRRHLHLTALWRLAWNCLPNVGQQTSAHARTEKRERSQEREMITNFFFHRQTWRSNDGELNIGPHTSSFHIYQWEKIYFIFGRDEAAAWRFTRLPFMRPAQRPSISSTCFDLNYQVAANEFDFDDEAAWNLPVGFVSVTCVRQEKNLGGWAELGRCRRGGRREQMKFRPRVQFLMQHCTSFRRKRQMNSHRPLIKQCAPPINFSTKEDDKN